MVAGAGTLASQPPLAVAGTGGCSTIAASATTSMAGSASLPSSPQGNASPSTGEIGPTRQRSGENRRVRRTKKEIEMKIERGRVGDR